MGIMRSFGAKLTGKRINTVVERAGTVSDRVPMRRRASMIDDSRVSIVRIGDGREPVLGIECDDKAIDLAHMRGVFKDGEVLDASIKDGCLYLTKGKDAYWFPLNDYYDAEPGYPDLKTATAFRIDPRMISDRYGRELKDGYAKLVADLDGNGRRIVRAYIYGPGPHLVDVVTLAGTWEGEPSVSRFPMYRLKDIGAFGKDVGIGMSTDHPLELITDDIVDSSYLVAPRLAPFDDEEREEYLTKERTQEEGWFKSHNTKRSVGRR